MKSKFFQMRVDEAFLRRLDDARRVEPDLPSRTVMVRRLIEWALVARTPEEAADPRAAKLTLVTPH